MRVLSAALAAAALAIAAFAAPAVAADDRPPRLLGRAILPSDAYQPGPPSGAFITGDNGVTPPFPGQPIPGFSAVLDAGHGEFWAMPDNGYGAKTNSGDFLLRLYRIRPDFKTAAGGTGAVAVLGFLALLVFPWVPEQGLCDCTPFPVYGSGCLRAGSAREETACDLEGYGPGWLVSRARSSGGSGTTRRLASWWSRLGPARTARDAVGSARGAAQASTRARAVAAGGRWISARSRRSWRRMCPGSAAPSMAWSWWRCRGRATAPATRVGSTTRPRGWRCTPPSRRSANCCGWRGRPSGGSSRGSLPTRRQPATGSTGCAGSGSTRSPTSAATST